MKDYSDELSDVLRISNLIKMLERVFEDPKEEWCFLNFLEKTINQSVDGYVQDCKEIYFDKKDGHFHSRLHHTNGGNMFDQRVWGDFRLSSTELWNMMNNEKARMRAVCRYENDTEFEANYKKLMQMLISWERIE